MALNKKEIDRNTRETKFIEKIYNMYQNEYRVIGSYINNNTKIKMKHMTCNHEYEVLPMQITRTTKPTRCPKCYGAHKKNTKIFKKEVYDKYNGEYELLSEYVNNKTKVLIVHHYCEEIYKVTPHDFLTGYRCPKCYGTPKKSIDILKKEFLELFGDEYIILSSKYLGTNQPITIKHKCGNIFETTPNKILHGGKRCSECLKSKSYSNSNVFIENYLISNNIEFESEKTFDSLVYKRNLYFDFFINKHNLAIEYDGSFHFEKIMSEEILLLQRLRDSIKNKWCIENNINLVRIDEKNIGEIKEILDSLFKNNESSTTIEKHNLFTIRDGKVINDNGRYDIYGVE